MPGHLSEYYLEDLEIDTTSQNFAYNILTLTNCVNRYAPDGELLSRWPVRPYVEDCDRGQELAQPAALSSSPYGTHSLEVLPKGELLVLGRDGFHHYSPDGTLVNTFPGRPQPFKTYIVRGDITHLPEGLDPEGPIGPGTIAYADPWLNRIQLFGPERPAWVMKAFDNPFLAGTPARIDEFESLDFDWSAAPPRPFEPDVAFSMRFEREIELDATQAISVSAQGGVRLWVNDQLLLDRWQSGAIQTGQLMVLGPGLHTMRLEYRHQEQGDETPYLHLGLEPSQNPTSTPPPATTQPSTATLTPTPTITLTPTEVMRFKNHLPWLARNVERPEAQPCYELIGNGGFEQGLVGWHDESPAPGEILIGDTGAGGEAPVQGSQTMLFQKSAPSGFWIAQAASEQRTSLDPKAFASSRLRLQVSAANPDQAMSPGDYLRISIRPAGLPPEEREALEALVCAEVGSDIDSEGWKEVECDPSEAISNSDWPAWQIVFRATALDENTETRWAVDAVSLEVCTK